MAYEGINRVLLVGRIDGEPRFSGGAQDPTKVPRLFMRVHCVEDTPDENGVPRTRQTWLSVVMFGRRAEALAKLLSAGRKVLVEGKLHHWKREGEHPPRWETQIRADNLVLLPSGRSETVPLRPPGAGSEAA